VDVALVHQIVSGKQACGKAGGCEERCFQEILL
jgi:hypothetical protein